MKIAFASVVFLFTASCAAAQDKGDPTITEIWNPVPKVIEAGKSYGGASSDAIVLYSTKKDSSNWSGINGKPFGWLADDSSLTVMPSKGDIQTKQAFGDCQLHIEWRTPLGVKGTGQDRGNSGIFFMGRYELQVLDNFNNVTYSNGQAGSIYKQRMPLVNVCRKPGEWQTYDVIFTAPVFYDNGMLKSAARITVLQNGVLVQNNVEIWGATTYIGVAKYEKHSSKEPLILQDHSHKVSYRNIWVREL
ncbi:MAG: DUF1080 domain-containing protein [Chitinophagaceae bacterium]